MAFDGVDYDATSFIWPNHGSPNAAVDSVVIGGTLEGAYFVARRHNQLLVSEATAWNGQRANSAIGTGFAVFSSDFIKWSNNPVWIAEGATHLSAHVVFGAQPISDTTATFRLGTYAPADTSFSTPLYGEVKPVSVHAGGFTSPFGASQAAETTVRNTGRSEEQEFSVEDLAAENLVYEADFEIALASPSPGYNTRVFAEGFLFSPGAVSYRPLYTTIWWEIRETVAAP